MTTTSSLFLPCVTVDSDGTIDIDWFDSYSNTVLDPNGPNDTVVYDEPEPKMASTLIDNILGDWRTDPAGALRRLATYIDQQDD